MNMKHELCTFLHHKIVHNQGKRGGACPPENGWDFDLCAMLNYLALSSELPRHGRRLDGCRARKWVCAEPIPQSKPKPGARRERVSFLYSCSDCAELNDHLPQVFLFKGKPKLKCGAWKTPHGLTPEEAPANYPKNRNKRGGFGTGATKIGECFQKNAPFWRRKLPRLFRSFFHFYSGFSRTTP